MRCDFACIFIKLNYKLQVLIYYILFNQALLKRK